MPLSYLYLADTSEGIHVAATSKDAPLSNPFSVMYDAYLNKPMAKQAGWYEVRVEDGTAHVPAHASAPVRAYVRAMHASMDASMSARVIMRANTRMARSTAIGLPGGPCHVIRNIEEENLAPRLRDELIEDIEKGKDLTNAQADKIYGRETFPLQLQVFTKLELTSHGQYRMDLRGVTVPEVKLALDEFVKWYMARRTDPKIKPQDQNLLIDLVQGDPVRFDAKKLGLTIVFMADPKQGIIRLVSTWWTDTPNPAKPKPGECSIIPFLDSRNRGEARPAILGSIHKAMIRQARIVAASLKINEIPQTMPASLKSIDWMEDTQKWLEEVKRFILKTSGVKGKSGTVKKERIYYQVVFGKGFPSIAVRTYGTDYALTPYMQVSKDILTQPRKFACETPEQAYKEIVFYTESIPMLVYAQQVVELFQKTTGAVSTPYVSVDKEGNVGVLMSMFLGGNEVGKLTGKIKPSSLVPVWTLNWKGTEQSSHELDVLLDMIDEEGDTLQPIFNNKTKLKKLVSDLEDKLGVPVKKVVGTHMEFGGKVSGISGHAMMDFKIIYDQHLDTWYFSPNYLDFFVDASALDDPSRRSLALLIEKATSADDDKYKIIYNFKKSYPNDLMPRNLGVQKVGNEYSVLAEGGTTFESKNVEDVIDHVREIIAFAGRLAT